MCGVWGWWWGAEARGVGRSPLPGQHRDKDHKGEECPILPPGVGQLRGEAATHNPQRQDAIEDERLISSVSNNQWK